LLLTPNITSSTNSLVSSLISCHINLVRRTSGVYLLPHHVALSLDCNGGLTESGMYLLFGEGSIVPESVKVAGRNGPIAVLFLS
jgi:hypothetical protein